VKTTWQRREKAAKRRKLLTLGLAVLLFLGGIVARDWWSAESSTVKQLTYDLEKTTYDLERAKYDLERTRVDLDAVRLELEKTSKISDIRKNIEVRFLKILDVYSKQSILVEAANKNSSKEQRDKTIKELAMLWKQEFPPLQENLTQLESALSALENREPRKFTIPVMEPMRR
jgi:hypothetical protein